MSRYKVDKWLGSRLGCRKLVNGHWCSVAVEFVSEQEICHGEEICLCAVRESGLRSHYRFILVAGVKAKTVTNNLPLLSVLANRSVRVMIRLSALQK